MIQIHSALPNMILVHSIKKQSIDPSSLALVKITVASFWTAFTQRAPAGSFQSLGAVGKEVYFTWSADGSTANIDFFMNKILTTIDETKQAVSARCERIIVKFPANPNGTQSSIQKILTDGGYLLAKRQHQPGDIDLATTDNGPLQSMSEPPIEVWKLKE